MVYDASPVISNPSRPERRSCDAISKTLSAESSTQPWKGEPTDAPTTDTCGEPTRVR